MNTQRHITAIMAAIGIGAMAPAWAQAQTAWNRKIEAISVLPGSAGGPSDIRVFLSVEADQPSVPQDLSTEILVMVNGTVIDVLQVGVDVNPASHSGCGIGCLAQQACICCEVSPGDIICFCGGFIAELPSQASLQPEDEIMVLLRPAPGALPENDDSDDTMITTYHGDPIFWNRRIASVDATPTPGAPSGFFDIFVEVEVEANYDGGLALASQLELQVNGVVVATADLPVLDLDFGWNQCSGLPCDDTVACVMDPAGPYYGTCQEDEGGAFGCSCQYHPVPDEVPPFLAVPLGPDDEVVIILRPVPGALPELPGFGDDDEHEVRTCPADFDADGIVNAADLALLLGAWGPNAGHPADLNGDDVVDAADLAMLLGNWGPCFPV